MTREQRSKSKVLLTSYKNYFMKYLLWFYGYKPSRGGLFGSAFEHDTIESALKCAMQYSPYSDIYRENKIYIVEEDTGKMVMTSKEVKAKIREEFKALIS